MNDYPRTIDTPLIGRTVSMTSRTGRRHFGQLRGVKVTVEPATLNGTPEAEQMWAHISVKPGTDWTVAIGSLDDLHEEAPAAT